MVLKNHLVYIINMVQNIYVKMVDFMLKIHVIKQKLLYLVHLYHVKIYPLNINVIEIIIIIKMIIKMTVKMIIQMTIKMIIKGKMKVKMKEKMR